MYLTGRGDGGPGFAAKLSPALDDPRVAVRGKVGSPLVSPWRLVMLGDRAGDLIPSTLVTSLAEPSRVAQTDWIKPGLSAWDWWNGPVVKSVGKAGTDTQTAKAFIDFAAAHGLPYSLIDEGWYQGAGGAGEVRPGADVMHWNPAIDLPALIDYGAKKNVRLWLWFNWRALDANMEAALEQYSHGDRRDQGRLHGSRRSGDGELVSPPAGCRRAQPSDGGPARRLCAARIDADLSQFHDAGRGDGRGIQQMEPPRHRRSQCDAGLYARAAGADGLYAGGFNNVTPAQFTPRNDLPFVQTTRAHGLALYVAFESAFACVSDSPDTYAASPQGLDFITALPTTWDETRFLGGDVGQYVAIARRKGTRWYVGVLNTAQARRVTLPLANWARGCG
jgi:alpha-glucosidase